MVSVLTHELWPHHVNYHLWMELFPGLQTLLNQMCQPLSAIILFPGPKHKDAVV